MCIFIIGDKVVQPVWTLLVCAVFYWLPTYDYCWCSCKMVLYKVYAVTIRTLQFMKMVGLLHIMYYLVSWLLAKKW